VPLPPGATPPTGIDPVAGPGEFSDVTQPGAVGPVQGPPGQNYGPGTQFGGQGTVGAQAGPGQYDEVQGFADQAYQQARRNIDPQQEQARRRMEQDLVNKGIDPTSAQGMGMLDQQSRNFSDQDQAANFGALQFGQGIQQQMFGQAMQNTQQAGNMQQALWGTQTAQRGQDMNRYSTDVAARTAEMGQGIQKYGMDIQGQIAQGQQGLQRYGMDVGARTAQGAQDVQRYGMDQQFNLGRGNLDLQRQGQDFGQMMGLEGVEFRNRAYNDKQNQYYDQLTMAMMGQTPVPGVIGYDPSSLAGTMYGSTGGGGFFG